MFDSLVNRGLTLAVITAGVAAFGFWQDGKAKAARIENLETQVAEQRADAAALRVLAARRPQVQVDFSEAMAALNAAGETSDACLADPRVRAAYDVIRLWDDADGVTAGGTAHEMQRTP